MAAKNVGFDYAELAVGDGAIAYVRAGAGRALVLLHGWTLDSRMWAPQFEALSGSYLLIAPDRRGFGRSSAPPDLSREPDDVVRLLDAASVERAVILGMSQAGRVALDFALRFADRTQAIVLDGAPLGDVTPGPGDDEAIPIVEYADLVRAGRLDEMKRLWRLHPLMRTNTATAARCVEMMLADYDGRDQARQSMATADEIDPERVTVPALVITGALDTPWRRRAGDALVRKLANASRVEIEGAGHLSNLCAPSTYNAALTRFLSTL